MKKIILGISVFSIILASCGKPQLHNNEVIITPEPVKVPYTNEYIRKVEEDVYVITDRNGRIEKYRTNEQEFGESEQVVGEDSSSTGEENESDSIDTSDSREATSVWESEPVSELVESESNDGAEVDTSRESGECSGELYNDNIGFIESESEYSDNSNIESDGEEYEEYDDGDAEESGLIYLGEWASTGYCPGACCCGEWASGYTASGTLATEGRTVACGSLPMGTEIYIEGYGYRIVEDLGVEGDWVDIFYSDHASASAHGLQYVDVYLVN